MTAVNSHEPVTLERDCEAVLIPVGTPLMLKAGRELSGRLGFEAGA